ncbi:MAG: AI-2E family transporter [Nocardioidaceae bacterium]
MVRRWLTRWAGESRSDVADDPPDGGTATQRAAGTNRSCDPAADPETDRALRPEAGPAASRALGPAETTSASADEDTETPDKAAPEQVAVQVERSVRETERLVEKEATGGSNDPEVTRPGAPINRRSPFYLGFMAVLGGLIAYGLVHMVLQLSQILTFILLAVFLSLGLEPIVARLARLGMRRGWAVLIVFVGLAGVVALLGWLIVPTVVDQTTQLIDKAPSYLTQLQHNRLVEDLNSRWHITDRVKQDLQQRVLTQGTFASVFGGILGAGKAIVDGVVAAFTVLVLTLYLLVAMPRVKTAAYQLVPHSRRPRVVYLSEEITRRVGGYVLGQLCVATINGVLSYIILRILGLPFPALLAVLVGLLALVPIVGTLIGGVLVTLVALTSSWTEAVIVLGYYVGYHLIEAYVLGPRIMRRAVDVPAVITIVAILAGGTLLGVLGALIAIPVAAGLMLIYEQVIVPRQQRV